MSEPDDVFTFVVLGKPISQGSKRHVGNGVMIESSAQLQPWRDAVAWNARRARPDGWPLDQAYSLHITFSFARPMSLARRVSHHVKRPDVDKLLRAVLDAMTGIVYTDDAQVDRVVVRKVYGEPGMLAAIDRVTP
jgi:crossover junction endodeoxyribonuclease RusA